MASAALAAAAAVLASATPALAQVPSLGKGHTILLNNGLQIWGLDTGASNFNYNNLAGANFNGVMWSWGVDPAPHPKLQTLTAGQKWGKWTEYNGNPATALDAIELSKKADLIAVQVGDEQQSDIENPNGQTKAWFQAAHAGNHFPDQLLYINSFFINSDAAYANFIAAANPDAIAFDSYPFNDPYGSVIMPHNWLALANNFRRHALGNAIGATNNAPRPYGLYLQTYQGTEATGLARHPGDVEMRWQQFTAWTMGYTFVNAFTVGGATSLFNGANMNSPWEPRYSQFAESARQGHNLGPALTRLISHGQGPSIIIGRDAAGNVNPVPSGWLPFHVSHAPVGQQYLTSVSAVNTGTKNGGQPGDVYVGFFKPLHASFGDTTDTYFMVTNALGAYLNDPTATVADTQQQITLNFDTQYSGISTLQRLRRSDGKLEIVPLNRGTARLYQLQFTLEGGTGDLFKYNDGSPFVGINNTLYWDNTIGAPNDPNTGTGLGGSGSWDSSSSRWYDGTSNGQWQSNRDAVFWGLPGTVTLASPQSVNSLTFKTNGYQLSGSTLTMAGQFITTDAGVTATIGSTLAGSGGIVKAGPGTLILSNPNSYTGGTTVLGGVMQISADGAMGPAPADFTAADIILNGGTLRFGANLDIANTRGIDIGPAGGTIDTQGFTNPAGYNAFQGGFRGPGDLTKLGSGTFFAAATTGGANSSWKGRLIIKEGIWRIVASDGLPYNPPSADGLQAEQVTLDGGTWQVASASLLSITNARRGIHVTANGGSIDTPGVDFTWAGPIGGPSNATLTKTGSGILRFTGVTYASNFNGNLQINGGTLRVDNQNAMGSNAAVNLANTAGATLHVAGNLALGSLAGGAASGGNVNLNAITFTVGGNNASTTFAGAITGANGNLAKAGTGTMTLTGASTYGQTTAVNAGALIINGTHTGAGNYTVAAGATLGGEGAINLKSAATAITVNGNLNPGDVNSIGALNINGGDLTLASTAAANFQIDLTTGAFDQVTIGDQLAYGGALNVTFTGSDADGAAFPIFTFTSQSGDFTAMNFTGHDPLQTVTFDKTTGVLAVSAIPEPGVLALLALGAPALLRRRRR